MLNILGIGPGSTEFILPITSKIIENSDIIIGGERSINIFSYLKKETFIIKNNLSDVCDYIVQNIDNKKISVLVSGDSGIFSIANYFKNMLSNIDFKIIPGISSIQYLCSKIGVTWSDICFVSFHGRFNDNLVELIQKNKKTIVFTDKNYTPNKICFKLIEAELTSVKLTVGENLSYYDEKIITGKPEEIVNLSFSELTIVLIENTVIFSPIISGVPDDMFIRGEVPMTKEEVRAVTLSKLRLTAQSIVYDIGAGTGSISIESALRCTSGKIYAIEKNHLALNILTQNISKFKLHNIEIINGTAPFVLSTLPEPDSIFIGGSGGNLYSILEHINLLKRNIRIVINTITIESTYLAIEYFKKMGFIDIEIINMSIAYGVNIADKHLMKAQNPIYIISANKIIQN